MTTKTSTDPAANPFVEADPQIGLDHQAIMEHYVHGTPIPADVLQRVSERAQKISDETFRKHGLVDIAVPAIRELRGELPQ